MLACKLKGFIVRVFLHVYAPSTQPNRQLRQLQNMKREMTLTQCRPRARNLGPCTPQIAVFPMRRQPPAPWRRMVAVRRSTLRTTRWRRRKRASRWRWCTTRARTTPSAAWPPPTMSMRWVGKSMSIAWRICSWKSLCCDAFDILSFEAEGLCCSSAWSG